VLAGWGCRFGIHHDSLHFIGTPKTSATIVGIVHWPVHDTSNACEDQRQMNHDRRHLLMVGAATALCSMSPRPASAAAYPERPVRVLLGFPAGGGADLLTRIICDWLQRRLGQAFVVENRPGAATNLATEAVARAPADGYTLLATTTSNLLNGALYDDLRYDFIRDIAPVASVSIQPLVLEVGPSVSARTLAAFISDAKARPGKLNVGHSGTGTISHLAGEALKLQAGIDFLTVPYRGAAPMLTDLLAGRIDAAIDNIAGGIEHIRAGRLHALAVTTSVRSEVLPDAPCLAEAVPGYEAYAIAGFGTPTATPADIIDKLNAEINAGLADASVKERLSSLGVTLLPGSPADFATRIALETEKWARVIRRVGIRPS
jgi:tripartite-type tricarboxylate transporter receptor subunit TctC